MGITHFAGLGKSPGAVTTGLSYLKHQYKDNREYGDIVEKVVIFTSPEIASGKQRAIKSVENKYMERNENREWPNGNSLEIIRKFLSIEFENFEELYICEVNVNKFTECFKVISKALLKFHSPGRVGNHIWANITGGTNVLNAALMQVAYLSGFIPILYYTFIANLTERKFLRPFSRNENEFALRKMYAFKTTFDKRYNYVLEELKSAGDNWIPSSDLLSRLKESYSTHFGNIDLRSFQRDYLNVMIGVERQGDRTKGQKDANRLSKDGKEMLDIMSCPLFKALTRQEDFSSNEINELFRDLEISKQSI